MLTPLSPNSTSTAGKSGQNHSTRRAVDASAAATSAAPRRNNDRRLRPDRRRRQEPRQGEERRRRRDRRQPELLNARTGMPESISTRTGGIIDTTA